MRLRRTLLGLMFLGAACTPGCSAEPPPADPEPVADSAPYLCTFVPERALRLVLGVTGQLVDYISGGKESGECSAPRDHPYVMAAAWLQEVDENAEEYSEYLTREHLADLLEDKKKAYSRHGGMDIPSDLGDGMTAKIPAGIPNLPYEIAAKFLCGGKERYLTFSFAEFAKGRDPFKDMIELMRIAQKRYAALHKCELGQ